MIHQTKVNLFKQSRENFIKLLNSLPEEKLFVIPKGFNNNIIWNFAHCVVAQQSLLYKISGNEVIVNDDLVNTYKKGSLASDVFLKGLKNQMIEISNLAVNKLSIDCLTPEFFDDFQVYPTSFGFEINSLDTALDFNNLHEGLHFGYAMALKRAI